MLLLFILREPIKNISYELSKKISKLKFGEIIVEFNEVEKFLEQVIGIKSSDFSILYRKNILWVDDEPNNNKLLVLFLEQKGALVKTALNTQEALKYMESNEPDIIISDMYRKNEPNGGLAGRNLFENKLTNKVAHKYIFCSTYNKNKFNKNSIEGVIAFSDGKELLEKIIGDLKR